MGKSTTFNPKVGQYHYERRGRGFWIYVCTHVTADGGSSSSPVEGEPVLWDMEDARRRVYELNGWAYREGGR